MPGFARREIVREGEIGIYHTWSRCVQRAFLCGYDPVTKTDFDHRRDWIKSLLKYQASVFAVDVGNYSLLSNHQHLIARTRPDIAARWSDEEVVWRWKLAWPSWVDGQWVREPTDEEIEELLAQPIKIPNLRANLSSLSWFMARWKEPIARMANREMNRSGHFYEQRFGSREIVDDPANLCCNVYLDLNQIKAGMAGSLEDCHCSAIQDRLQAWREEEARASVETFHANDPQEFSLEVGDVEQLLADCFLAPIGDQDPPMPAKTPSQTIVSGSSVDAPDPEGSKSSTESTSSKLDELVLPEPVVERPADASDLAENIATANFATTAGPRSSARVRTDQSSIRPVPTRKIHNRLQSHRRHRASDHRYLGLPQHQYLEIVRWTAERTLEKRADEEKPHSPPDNVTQILRRWGIAPDMWCEVIDKFASWFRRAVGHTDNLAAPIQRANKRWLQGIRPCRQVFT